MSLPWKTRRAHVAAALALIALVTGCDLIKPKPKKPFGEACESPFDCESTNCNRERGGFCSKACKADSECGGDYVCAGEPTGTGGSCAKKKGSPTGTACSNRDECDHGTCLKKGNDAVGFCSQRCVTKADCPAGYQDCQGISDMGAQRLCLPGDAPAAPAAPATPAKAPPAKAPAKH